MTKNEFCVRWAPNQASLHLQDHSERETPLHGETSVVELISIGAPLPAVLNRLCEAIDLQIGNVVSVIILTENRRLREITRNALQFGLQVFWSSGILSRNEEVLGSFQMYCCVSRSPTPLELQLIDRVTQLAALAIQGQNHEKTFEILSRNRKRASRRGSREAVYLN
jgi:hypothetical protein